MSHRVQEIVLGDDATDEPPNVPPANVIEGNEAIDFLEEAMANFFRSDYYP